MFDTAIMFYHIFKNMLICASRDGTSARQDGNDYLEDWSIILHIPPVYWIGVLFGTLQ
jgi:hypothetical protein